MSVVVRKARFKDSKFLWRLRNQKSVRNQSFNLSKIPFANHKRWFETNFKNPDMTFFIVSRGIKPVGYVRFDRKKDNAVVSVAISRQFSGNGYGQSALRGSAQKYFKSKSIKKITAYIKNKNTASVRCFEKAGYSHAGKTKIKSFPCFKMIKERNK